MGNKFITPKLVLGESVNNSEHNSVGGLIWGSVNDSTYKLVGASLRHFVYSSVWEEIGLLIVLVRL